MWLAWAVALLWLPCASAQVPGRVIDFVELSPNQRHVDVLVQFNCPIRYLTHAPLDAGSAVRIRLRPGAECGSVLRSEQAPVGGQPALVRVAELVENAPGELLLTLEFTRELHYVLAPTSNRQGLRIRLLDAQVRAAQVSVVERDALGSGYAINLDSATEPFSDEAVRAAGESLRMVAYVSTLDLEGTIWYRLRVGPIASRADAERLLAVAKQRYPRAWLGIDDESEPRVVTDADVPDVKPTVPIDPPLPDAERRSIMSAARAALARREHARATELLTKLTRQPEYPERARAQELLGLSRERAGQLSHAKAEYLEYLRRYPSGDAVSRIRSRLRTLASAGRRGRRGTGGSDGDGEGAWRVIGAASQMYRWEQSSVETVDAFTEQQNQNAVYTDADVTARRRGERFDFVGRLSAGYAKDMLDRGPGDQTRVSAAFVEVNDRELGMAARLGRQVRNSGGLLGTFDGLFGSWQWRPGIAINASAGLPVESTRDGPQSDRRFFGLAAVFGPFNDRWDFGAFLVNQSLAGVTDRQAVGVEGRYFVPGKTFIALLDFDLHYSEINSVVLMGSLQLPARWSVSFNADHRRSPVLTTRNALIGQPVRTLDELQTLFTISEIERIARDRTPLADIWSLSLSRPIGERFQFSVDAYASRSDPTIASAGVAATPGIRLDRTIQAQISASSLFRSSDLWVLAARDQVSDAATTRSISIASRVPVGSGAWRIGPRLRVDQRESQIDSAQELLLVPTLRIDYQRGRLWLEFEAGAEFGDRTLAADDETTKRYYFGLGYRLSF
ncbi:MAG: SPOR domain-containing protein [Steroidobacteraceae bacterium]